MNDCGVAFRKGFDERRFGIGSKHSEETRKKMIGNQNARKYPKKKHKIGKSKSLRNKIPTIGKIGLGERIRKSNKYVQWRNRIFERDDYTCQFCRKRGKKINADHIISLADIIEKLRFEQGVDNILYKAMNYPLLWDTNNGRTLCVDCHKKTSTWGGKNKGRSRERC